MRANARLLNSASDRCLSDGANAVDWRRGGSLYPGGRPTGRAGSCCLRARAWQVGQSHAGRGDGRWARRSDGPCLGRRAGFELERSSKDDGESRDPAGAGGRRWPRTLEEGEEGGSRSRAGAVCTKEGRSPWLNLGMHCTPCTRNQPGGREPQLRPRRHCQGPTSNFRGSLSLPLFSLPNASSPPGSSGSAQLCTG